MGQFFQIINTILALWVGNLSKMYETLSAFLKESRANISSLFIIFFQFLKLFCLLFI